MKPKRTDGETHTLVPSDPKAPAADSRLILWWGVSRS